MLAMISHAEWQHNFSIMLSVIGCVGLALAVLSGALGADEYDRGRRPWGWAILSSSLVLVGLASFIGAIIIMDLI